ncbi:hypothetical protein HBI56_138640 [Parastagonospora nodorum]|nr:hypothetical protein HBH56_129170 [Parastagonospora nodorum]KAH3931218.1 hypothetical protein HBH54_094310 [Parastagonospora nodorum]KAH3947182.1 hypothetical protein HBH53_119450 [Parastagonospora nodorum]KAH3970699.1 hypothetical protein HBH51_115870 [Parastagonospora nodorum]KAH3971559.1 hypothetical protein HBH52_158140 [Parastagonospora nodorum]
MLLLLALQAGAIAEHSHDLLSMGGLRLLLAKALLTRAERRLSSTPNVQTLHQARDVLFPGIARHLGAWANWTKPWNGSGPSSEGIIDEAWNGRTGGTSLTRRRLIATWRCDAAIAWLALQTVGTGVMLQLIGQDAANLNLPGKRLLLRSQMLLLTGH